MSSPAVGPPSLQRARLSRSRDDRIVAGVAGGLGHHLGLDPVIIRLVFVVLALAGGGGLLAYVIAWIVIPEPPLGEQPATVRTDPGASVLAGVALIALGGLLLLERLVPALSWRYIAPALLVALGALLLTRSGVQR